MTRQIFKRASVQPNHIGLCRYSPILAPLKVRLFSSIHAEQIMQRTLPRSLEFNFDEKLL